MIWSVSTLLRRSGTPGPVWVTKASMSALLCRDGFQVGRGRERAADGRGRGHRHRHEVGASPLALTALEVAVGRRRTPLAWLEGVGVHAQAHRAARAPPLRAGLLEDDVEALLLGLEPHADRAGYDEQAGVLVDVAPLDD